MQEKAGNMTNKNKPDWFRSFRLNSINYIKDFQKKFGALILNPISAVLITVLIIFTGVFGSIFASEIKKTIMDLFDIEDASFIFLILVVAIALLFFIRQHFEDKKERETIEKLNETIRPIPSTEFLDTYNKMYSANRVLKHSLFEDYTREKNEKLIRTYLVTILTLVKLFDRGKKNFYGVNIMVFKEIDSLDWNETKKRLRFVDQEIQKENLEGILDVEISLSVNSETQSGYDDQLEVFALPVPRLKENTINKRKYTRVLPGAPTAYYTKDLSRFQNTNELIDWCNSEGDFTRSVKDQLSNYFDENESTIKAFLSLPVKDYTNKVIAVVNIHSNSPSLLEKEDKLMQFYMFVNPFVLDIFELLDKWGD